MSVSIRTSRRFAVGLFWLGVMAGCGPSPEGGPLADLGGGTPTAEAAALITKPFDPAPIVVRAEDLPPPHASPSVDHPPTVLKVPQTPVLYAPPGFSVEVFAEGLTAPRWMELTPEGDLLVTENKGARVRRLKIAADYRHATIAGFFATSANGVNQAMGMGFLNQHFLLANTDGVRSYPYVGGAGHVSGKGKLFTPLPASGYNNHWTRNLVIDGARGKVYVSIGSGTNASVEASPRATIIEMNLDGSGRRVLASGMRNPIGFDLHPITGELYSTVTERDGLGDDLVPDFFVRVQDGGFYGWPYTYLKPNLLDPRHVDQRPGGPVSERPELAAKTLSPDVLFRAHSSPIGFRFARGGQFPAPYAHGGFVALRGSWNRSASVGFEIGFIPFGADHRPMGHYQTFVKGFVTDPKHNLVWGRPAGIFFLPDGSLLFSEEANGRIYRVSYVGHSG